MKFYASLALPPGKYTIKSLIRVAKVNRRGYARTDVVVAEPGQTAAPPPDPFETAPQSP